MVQRAGGEETVSTRPLTPDLIELEWLGDPKDKPLLNAENLTMTKDGRLFVTGRERVCEIVPNGKGGYEWTDVLLPDDLPKTIYRNGIATDDRYLYLACAEVDQEAQPLLRNWLPQLTGRPQDALGFMLLMLAETLCPVRSFVLRAELSTRPLHFSDRVALSGKCFANGLAVDGHGFVYAANSVPGHYAIHRVRPGEWTTPGASEKTLWHPTDLYAPNGVKIRNDTLYFTRIGGPPLFLSTVTALTLEDKPRVKDDSLCRQYGVLYDDFDVVDDSFVIAAVSDLTNVFGSFSGALAVFGADGIHRHDIRDARIKHPSAVLTLHTDTRFGESGDLLLTEKDTHTVWRLRLRARPSPDA
jgi:hypothetical protein